MDEKKFAYEILPEINLVIKYYRGQLGIKDIIRFTEETSQDDRYSSRFNVLYDIRELDIKIDEIELEKFVKGIKDSERLFGKRNVAFLTETPNQVVFSSILNLHFKEIRIISTTVSTLQAAADFLQLTYMDLPIIEKTLKKLKGI